MEAVKLKKEDFGAGLTQRTPEAVHRYRVARRTLTIVTVNAKTQAFDDFREVM